MTPEYGKQGCVDFIPQEIGERTSAWPRIPVLRPRITSLVSSTQTNGACSLDALDFTISDSVTPTPRGSTLRWPLNSDLEGGTIIVEVMCSPASIMHSYPTAYTASMPMWTGVGARDFNPDSAGYPRKIVRFVPVRPARKLEHNRRVRQECYLHHCSPV